ncbi:MAG TPA: hypothetical protein VKA48_00845, partial [Gammaproteobacteria bacterium]|nr:hypothetical protein [Gammaproteobacteria bacterium]
IIPSPGAAGQVSDGKLYFVGATLEYDLAGEHHETEVAPDSITVRPLPLLSLDYFLKEQVYADDPFTEETEPAGPFTLHSGIPGTPYLIIGKPDWGWVHG